MTTRQKPRRRVKRPALCPTLVAFTVAPEVEAGERMSVQAFREGWAGRGQFNILADCRDLLTLAAAHKNDQGVLAVCRAAGFALANIKDRYLATQKMGCTGEEMKAITVLVDISQDFWRRQSGNLFAAANRALDKARGYDRTGDTMKTQSQEAA